MDNDEAYELFLNLTPEQREEIILALLALLQ